MNFLGRFTMSLVGVLAMSGAYGQDQPVQIKSQQVSGPVYMIEGQGGNIGVSAGEDGLLMIDTQFDRIAKQIREAMTKINPGELRFVLNTHFHGDHAGGNPTFGQEAPIIAHVNARTRLITANTDMKDKAVRNSLPLITFDDDLSLHFNGEEIKVVHYPTGHTDTDCIVFFTKSNVVHMGDHFFVDAFPFIDVAGGGNVDQYLKNVRAVLETLPDDVKIIPGHGPLASKEDMQRFVDTVAESVEILRKGVDAGKTAQELTEAGLPEKFKSWGAGFVSTNRWIAIVHNSLSKK